MLSKLLAFWHALGANKYGKYVVRVVTAGVSAFALTFVVQILASGWLTPKGVTDLSLLLKVAAAAGYAGVTAILTLIQSLLSQWLTGQTTLIGLLAMVTKNGRAKARLRRARLITPKGFALGHIPDAGDPTQDALYAAEPAPYAFVDLKKDPAMPPVWDQGQLGSCTAHGTLACLLFAAAKLGLKFPMLSRLFLYYATRSIEGTVSQDSGGQIRDAVTAATLGLPPESDWPYDITTFTDPPSAMAKADATFKALQPLRVPATIGAIQACLSEGFPVDIGVTLYASFEAAKSLSSGVAPMPRCFEQQIGGHCMAIVGIGYGRDWKKDGQYPIADDNTLYVELRNSWGTGVYQGGYLLIPAEYIEKFGGDYWTIRGAVDVAVAKAA